MNSVERKLNAHIYGPRMAAHSVGESTWDDNRSSNRATWCVSQPSPSAWNSLYTKMNNDVKTTAKKPRSRHKTARRRLLLLLTLHAKTLTNGVIRRPAGLKTRSSATSNSTARPSCLVGVLYDISPEKICWWLINNFYVIGPKSYRIRRNNANYTAITPFRVIQGHRFWYQSKAHMRLSISD